MGEQNITTVEKLADQVGYVSKSDFSNVLGSCFLVELNIVVTCCHALSCDDSFTDLEYLVKFPRLNKSFKARVIPDEINYEEDIAFLFLNDSFSTDYELTPIGSTHTFGGKFSSFGFMKYRYYDGLFATGEIVDCIMNAAGQKLLQLKTSGIERGMSGAPVLDLSQGIIIGMVREYWDSVDSTLAFATPSDRLISVRPSIISSAIKTPVPVNNLKNRIFKNLSEEKLVLATMRAALLVCADQFKDGSWGRSLWKETGKITITTDIAEKNLVGVTHEKKAISVTAWAAQAIAKSSEITNLQSVKRAAQFAISHQDMRTGAIGNIYVSNSATPLVSKFTFIRSPRHTASGIKIIELAQGLTRNVIDGCEFIIENECRAEGGWGESIGDPPNTLSTAYVLDSLIKLLEKNSNLKSRLSEYASNSIRPAIKRGQAWLIRQRGSDFLWDYMSVSALKPMYSAFILAFVPQMSKDYYEEIIESIESLLGLSVNGGIPSLMTGEPDTLTTALCIYAMLRVNCGYFEEYIQSLLNWLVDEILTDKWASDYRSMHGIFALTILSYLFKDKVFTHLEKIFNLVCDTKFVLMDKPTLWLAADKEFELGLKNALLEMYA